MKKFISILMIIMSLYISPFALTNQKADNYTSNGTFVLPASILLVDNEAFSGTSVETAVFPNGFLLLGDMAFSSASELRRVYLPASLSEIGTDVFSENTNLTIHGVEKSFAQTWAEENGITFVNDDIWAKVQTPNGFHVESLLALSFIICPFEDERIRRIKWKAGEFLCSMRPQDRPELNPIDYRFP